MHDLSCTVWKLQNFFVTHISREIMVSCFRSSKTTILTDSEDFSDFSIVHSAQELSTYVICSYWNLMLLANIDFT